MTDVLRLDFGRLGKVQRTPQGGIRVPANITRSGIFIYRRADGTTIREFRPADEVFHADSLATLSGAPVTDLHPSSAVRPSNWRSLSVGHVGENIKQDGKFVAAKLLIQDQDTISKVDAGDRKELSCGYTCRIDETPGEFEGQRYDAIQRKIRYNHVALGPANWGRAGNEVALRLDSRDAVQVTEDSAGTTAPPKPAKGKSMSKYRIDGVDYDTSSPEFLQALDLRDKRADAESAALVAERDTAQAKADAAAKESAAAKADLDKVNDPARLDALVAGRVALVTDARKILGSEAKLDGKTDREIMIEAIKHDSKDFDAEGKSDDYVIAYFEATTKNTKRHDEGGTGIGAVRSAAVASVQKPRADGADADEHDRYDAIAAQKRMVAHQQEAANAPLRFSRSN